jgi:hypothetical protein
MTMKIIIARLLLLLGFVMLAASLQAQPTAHYVPGVEGIKAASLPPPGWYLRDYNVGYYSDRYNDGSGDKVDPLNLKASTYANVPRLIWISETKLFGGNIGADALLPLIYQSSSFNVLPPYITPGGKVVRKYDHSSFGIGDLFAESTLSWHLQQFDFSSAVGVWMPTGNSGKPPTTDAGQGYWTTMLTAGATWYMDTNKTWAVSALCRYEMNTEQVHTDVTTGNAFTLEWGVSKTLAKIYDVGIVGYYQQKVTGDSGSATYRKPHDRVAAIGPEFSVAFPKQMFFVSLRYLNEFMAENRAMGNTFTLTLTKRF